MVSVFYCTSRYWDKIRHCLGIWLTMHACLLKWGLHNLDFKCFLQYVHKFYVNVFLIFAFSHISFCPGGSLRIRTKKSSVYLMDIVEMLQIVINSDRPVWQLKLYWWIGYKDCLYFIKWSFIFLGNEYRKKREVTDGVEELISRLSNFQNLLLNLKIKEVKIFIKTNLSIVVYKCKEWPVG